MPEREGTRVEEIAWTVARLLLALASFAGFYWALRAGWGANPAFAAGGAATAAVILWGRR